MELGEETLFKATRYVNYLEREANRNELLEAIETEKAGDQIFGIKDEVVNLYSTKEYVEADKEAFASICVKFIFYF